MLIDLRVDSTARKIIMNNNLPCVAWNPQNPQMCLVGSEDSNIYQYDIRFLDKPSKIRCPCCWYVTDRVRRGHVRAINGIAFSTTGQLFTTASDDNTIRVFTTTGTLPARDCYHAKRMQNVQCVEFSRDANYIFSGSSDFVVISVFVKFLHLYVG